MSGCGSAPHSEAADWPVKHLYSCPGSGLSRRNHVLRVLCSHATQALRLLPLLSVGPGRRFELETNSFQFHAIANLDKTSLFFALYYCAVYNLLRSARTRTEKLCWLSKQWVTLEVDSKAFGLLCQTGHLWSLVRVGLSRSERPFGHSE